MKTRLLFSLYLCAVLFAAVAVCEVIFEYTDTRAWTRKDAIISPYYQWCFTTDRGDRIGPRHGRLKLMYHPYLVYSNLPNQTDPHFHINSLGARGPEIAPHVPGRTRILVLGGSAAFGTGLNDDSETLATQLEVALSNAEVINAAVIGHQSRQELTAYINKWSDLAPDLVVDFGGYNDFAYGPDRSPDFGGMNLSWQMQAELEMWHRVAYAELPTRLLNGYRALFPAISRRLTTESARRPAPVPASATAFFASNMEKLNKSVKAYGGGFLCLFQPTRLAWRDSSYTAFKTAARRQLARVGVDVIDAEELVVQLTPSMFMDEVHLNAEGNRVLAVELARELRKRGVR